jgi:UDP-N-acetylmuramate: L-alanyl-gamma-D-glutamyl-meso-diaminopimelate ligase
MLLASEYLARPFFAEYAVASMRIHIVGVAGTGMGSLAGLLASLGHRVSGSDVRFDPPIGPMLEQWGVDTAVGFSEQHLEERRPELVVIGNVCRRDNPEAMAAMELGLTITHIAGALQRFALYGREVSVIAGTHGKTTTSSLVAWLLDATGKKPGFFIGGVPRNFDQGFRVTAANHPFVIEGDEYDTAYFEKTAKFLHYTPRHAIVTSVEHDHIDIYPTKEAYLEAFRRFIGLVPDTGVLVVHAGDSNLCRLLKETQAQVQAYSVEGFASPKCSVLEREWRASDVQTTPNGGQTFIIHHNGERVARAEIGMSGLHNVANALAALILCHTAYGVPLPALLAALPDFEGTRRRQELLGEPGGVRIYDDFAHHPTAVSTTLWGLRRRHPEGKLVAVFEPRSATACRNLHQTEYEAAFDAADVILLAPLGRKGLPKDEQLDTAAIAAALRMQSKVALACSSIDVLEQAVLDHVSPGDTLALLSNGAFDALPARLSSSLASHSETEG